MAEVLALHRMPDVKDSPLAEEVVASSLTAEQLDPMEAAAVSVASSSASSTPLAVLLGEAAPSEAADAQPLIRLIQLVGGVQWCVSLAMTVLSAPAYLALFLAPSTPCNQARLSFLNTAVSLQVYFSVLHYVILQKRLTYLLRTAVVKFAPTLAPTIAQVAFLATEPSNPAAAPSPTLVASRSCVVISVYETVALLQLLSQYSSTCTPPKGDRFPPFPIFATCFITAHAAAVAVIVGGCLGLAQRHNLLAQLATQEFWIDLRSRINHQLETMPSPAECVASAVRCLHPAATTTSITSTSSVASPLSIAAPRSASRCPFAAFASVGAKCPVTHQTVTAPIMSSPAAIVQPTAAEATPVAAPVTSSSPVVSKPLDETAPAAALPSSPSPVVAAEAAPLASETPLKADATELAFTVTSVVSPSAESPSSAAVSPAMLTAVEPASSPSPSLSPAVAAPAPTASLEPGEVTETQQTIQQQAARTPSPDTDADEWESVAIDTPAA